MSSLHTALTMLKLAERRAVAALRQNADMVVGLLTADEAAELSDLLRRRLELSCPELFCRLRAASQGSLDPEIHQELLRLDCATVTELLLFELAEQRIPACAR